MPLDEIEEAASLFAEVIAADPLSGALFLVGNVLLFGSIAVFAVLAIWGVLAALRPA